MHKQERDLDPSEEEDIRDNFPELNGLFHLVNKRMSVYSMPNLSGDHIIMSWLCLNDLSEMFQNAVIALREAKFDWAEHKDSDEESAILHGVKYARYEFDYGTLLLSAASNHLASAMWHFHEEIKEPLGRDYKTAAQVRSAWKKRQSPPASFNDVNKLLNYEDWENVMKYRHQWVHRGMPVIRGELKFGRKEIWGDKDDPEPSTYMVKVESEDEVFYDTNALIPDYEMGELLETATNAIWRLDEVSRDFIDRFDELLLQMDHWNKNEEGKLVAKLL